MSNANEHLDIDELKKAGRQGWFVKVADDMPAHKVFRTSCKQGARGFLGPNFGAHHIIPFESIRDSTLRYDPDYIEDIKFITPFILNRPSNMIGLPSFWSYDAWYRAQGDTNYPGLTQKYETSFKDSTRSGWARAIRIQKDKSNPENYPVHIPETWGHAEYTDQVSIRLEQQIWKVVGRKRKKHISKEALKGIQDQLAAIESDLYGKLTSRGATSLQLWERRNDPSDNGWHGPFTMTDISKNPIWG